MTTKRGYTILEIAIVITVLVILSGAIYEIISRARDAAESLDVRAQLTENARTAMTEIVRDLSEASSDTVTVDGTDSIPSFLDPLNNEIHQILIFPSARGDPAVAAEDGSHANNDYVHLDSGYRPTWRSLIVYCTYITSDGIQQLRKYVDYDNAYGQEGMFPFSLIDVTAGAINLRRGDGQVSAIARNSGTVRANYVTAIEAVTTGADFEIDGALLKINLYLSKSELPSKGGTRSLTVTLTDSVLMRNK